MMFLNLVRLPSAKLRPLAQVLPPLPRNMTMNYSWQSSERRQNRPGAAAATGLRKGHRADLLSVVNAETSRPLATLCLARAWADIVDAGIGDVLKRVAADDKEFDPEVWIQDMCEKVSVLYFQKMEPTAWMEEQVASLVAKDFASCVDSIAVLCFLSMVNPLTTL